MSPLLSRWHAFNVSNLYGLCRRRCLLSCCSHGTFVDPPLTDDDHRSTDSSQSSSLAPFVMQQLMSLCVDLSHTRRGRQSVVKHAFVAGVKNLVHLICCLVKLSRFNNNCLFSAWLGIRMIYGWLAVSPFSVGSRLTPNVGKHVSS